MAAAVQLPWDVGLMQTNLDVLDQHTCSKYGFGIVMLEGIIDLRLIVMLLVGMSWADVLSVMLARGVMCDVRHQRQEAERDLVARELGRGS